MWFEMDPQSTAQEILAAVLVEHLRQPLCSSHFFHRSSKLVWYSSKCVSHSNLYYIL